MTVPGKPALWILVAAAPIVPVLSGWFDWPVAIVVSLTAMSAAVINAYQEAARLRANEEQTDMP